MQLIHLTYSWYSRDSSTEERKRHAFNTWANNSDPKVYTAMHLEPQHALFTSQHIGDEHPYPILKMIIDQAFETRRDDDTVVLFVNADIRLRDRAWPIVEKRIRSQQAHYEDCIHTRKQKEDEAQSDPVTFLIPYLWWMRHKQYIPPVLFACPCWEPPYQYTIDRTQPKRMDLPQFTSHVPHKFWEPFRMKRTQGIMFNHSLATGWSNLNYDIPSMHTRLQRRRTKPTFPNPLLCGD